MAEALHIVCPHCARLNRVPAERLDAGGKCGACHQPLFTGQPVSLDGPGIKRHVESNDIPVLADFWAEWCAPCKMMAPAFAQAAATLEPRLRFAKVDTEAAPDAAARYGIRGIPTLILFRGGQEQTRISGAMDAPRLISWIQQQI